ncbi:hypothetical protein HGRIS_001232 [Hohenbuehelia grisea]|uniref:Uncharacterized protein n=1 Tax=Hohenbuehelia grisea TaxID=104357 RepID=A0ABR3JPQ2_9AGAR
MAPKCLPHGFHQNLASKSPAAQNPPVQPDDVLNEFEALPTRRRDGLDLPLPNTEDFVRQSCSARVRVVGDAGSLTSAFSTSWSFRCPPWSSNLSWQVGMGWYICTAEMNRRKRPQKNRLGVDGDCSVSYGHTHREAEGV